MPGSCMAQPPSSFFRVIVDRHVYGSLIALSSHVPSPKPFLNHTRDLTLSGLQNQIPYSQSFIADFAPYLSHLECLAMTYFDWYEGVLTDSFYMSLTSLTSLSSLSLIECSFHHEYDFDRLICALPALKILKLSSMLWYSNDTGMVNISSNRPLRLESLWVEEGSKPLV